MPDKTLIIIRDPRHGRSPIRALPVSTFFTTALYCCPCVCIYAASPKDASKPQPHPERPLLALVGSASIDGGIWQARQPAHCCNTAASSGKNGKKKKKEKKKKKKKTIREGDQKE
ncbi:hypothetical protein M406DRAFT_330574 [Cryphonectria parasitica EP155]|uniref:Uncharacterized protein n=1 Tax=Cryphonectria parasitica (strain ATCC 38755 / EP155) TaxID=660469 RepID=A0A9P5CNS1_CRYP1|nr:uncharacterized protein M406DRAFT_330574 [Cryphonectria parasitica EP155]KAF3764225.1 hypothetical protein M406DRAFT_330574 [Cryphonectria parasitica EP155]